MRPATRGTKREKSSNFGLRVRAGNDACPRIHLTEGCSSIPARSRRTLRECGVVVRRSNDKVQLIGIVARFVKFRKTFQSVLVDTLPSALDASALARINSSQFCRYPVGPKVVAGLAHGNGKTGSARRR
jgi:hypothetical protein